MDEAILFLKLGLYHVLDWQAYDHVLFLIVLAVIYTLIDWKKVFWLITLFTLGHSLSLTLSAYKIAEMNTAIVEFLIPLTIFITAVTNIFTVKNKNKSTINLFFAFFFGLIHGLGFSTYFKMLVDDTDAKLLPLFNFAIGIEIAQVIIVMAILSIAYSVQKFFKVPKRDWVLVISVIVIGIVIPMLIERKIW